MSAQGDICWLQVTINAQIFVVKMCFLFLKGSLSNVSLLVSQVNQMFVFISDERSNQLLVLRTQQQGWRNQSSTERLVSKERHYAVLQEAAGLVVEDRRADMRAIRGTSPDDLEVAADIMADLQHQQEVESHMLLSLHSKV